MNLPDEFLKSIEDCAGFEKDDFVSMHSKRNLTTSIRINTSKISPSTLPVLKDSVAQVPWNNNGYYLSQRPSFTLDPLFHAGAYYVQEASSMFLKEMLLQVVHLNMPLKVLDACAAPGGKSTLIQSVISPDSLLVSNEIIKTRVNILRENICKWGAANVVVTNNNPKDFLRLSNFFDVIVVDAPCSGSGLFRKDENAINEWSLDNVALCSQRQQHILADLIPSLKDKGVLIYSTCSYSKMENEEICDWIVDTFSLTSLTLKIDPSWGIVETESDKHKVKGFRFYPNKLSGEGFFIAAFTCNNSNQNNSKYIKFKSKNEISNFEFQLLQYWLKNAKDFFFLKQHTDVLAIPSCIKNDLGLLQQNLYLKKAGIIIGTIIRNDLIPNHELALSKIANDNINKVEVEEFIALQFLRKQEIKLDTNLKGWVLLTFKNINLGWVKILSNRINNYYPKEWRILNK